MGDTVRFALHVTNAGADTVALEFPTAQRYDFVVLRPGGEEVWRWSSEVLFAQVLGTLELGPGQSVTYRAAWPPAGRRGRFVAVGVVPAAGRRIERRVPFEIP